jgi:hypothetical protein
MVPSSDPLTLPASVPAPYVHLDNRALVLHDGRATVLYGSAAFTWLGETLRVLGDERRATRQQGSQVFGGVVHDDGSATLYGGAGGPLVTLMLDASAFAALRGALSR